MGCYYERDIFEAFWYSVCDLRENGEVSEVDLAAKFEINRYTVSVYMRGLEFAGKVKRIYRNGSGNPRKFWEAFKGVN